MSVTTRRTRCVAYIPFPSQVLSQCFACVCSVGPETCPSNLYTAVITRRTRPCHTMPPLCLQHLICGTSQDGRRSGLASAAVNILAGKVRLGGGAALPRREIQRGPGWREWGQGHGGQLRLLPGRRIRFCSRDNSRSGLGTIVFWWYWGSRAVCRGTEG